VKLPPFQGKNGVLRELDNHKPSNQDMICGSVEGEVGKGEKKKKVRFSYSYINPEKVKKYVQTKVQRMIDDGFLNHHACQSVDEVLVQVKNYFELQVSQVGFDHGVGFTSVSVNILNADKPNSVVNRIPIKGPDYFAVTEKILAPLWKALDDLHLSTISLKAERIPLPVLEDEPNPGEFSSIPTPVLDLLHHRNDLPRRYMDRKNFLFRREVDLMLNRTNS